jgi:hypothetical protein
MTSVCVTALYDLPFLEKNIQRRDMTVYFHNLQKLIANPNVEFVLFTHQRLLNDIKRIVANNPRVVIVQKEFDELWAATQRETIVHNRSLHPYHTSNALKDTVSFQIIMWSKFEFLRLAEVLRPEVEKYVWIDAGIMHVAAQNNSSLSQALACLSPDGVSCMPMNVLDKHEYNSLAECCGSWRFRQVGGFWAVGKVCVQFFLADVRRDMEFILDQGYMCSDEDLLARFTFRHPNRCHFCFGDYASCVSNWCNMWHDAHIARAYIEKAHVCGLHYLCKAGTLWLIQGWASSQISTTLPEVMTWFVRLFLALYHLEETQSYTQLSSPEQMQLQVHFTATTIAKFVFYLLDKHPIFAQANQDQTTFLQSLFLLVDVTPETNHFDINNPQNQHLNAWLKMIDNRMKSNVS